MNDQPKKYESVPASAEMHDEVGPAPADAYDPVIEAFKKDVDRSLLLENLKLTPRERSEKFLSVMEFIYEIRGKANPKIKVWR